MTIAEAAALLSAKFVLHDAYEEARGTVRAICTRNQLALIARLPASDKDRALRSIANKHVTASCEQLLQTLRKDRPDDVSLRLE